MGRKEEIIQFIIRERAAGKTYKEIAGRAKRLYDTGGTKQYIHELMSQHEAQTLGITLDELRDLRRKKREQRVEYMRDALSEGKSLEEIAEYLGVTIAVLYQYKKRYGIAVPSRKEWREKRNQEMKRLRDEELLTLAEIGKRFGLKPTRVGEIFKDMANGRGRHPNVIHLRNIERDAQILADKEKGLTWFELSEKYGLSKSRIGQILMGDKWNEINRRASKLHYESRKKKNGR